MEIFLLEEWDYLEDSIVNPSRVIGCFSSEMGAVRFLADSYFGGDVQRAKDVAFNDAVCTFETHYRIVKMPLHKDY